MKHKLLFRLRCAALVFLFACLCANANGNKPSHIRVYCPAIGTEDRPRTNFVGESARQPTLVVLGTARRAAPTKQAGHEMTEITAEKVLFGSTPGNKFSCLSGLGYRPKEKSERLILALAPNLASEEFSFEIRYTLPPEEEKAVLALSAARMDYNALSAEIIFVGKEVSADANKGRVNEVVRVLRGPDTLKGKKVCVDLLEHRLRTGFIVPPKPLPTKGEHLYFVSAIDRDYKKRALRSIANPDGPVYLVRYRLPGVQEKNVAAALERRGQHPLVQIEEDGEKVNCLEILFRGTIAEAIELLNSESEGANVLGCRFLMRNTKEARKPVLEAIEKVLLRTENKLGFHRLRSLIQLLPGLLPPERRTEDVELLVEKWLAHLATNPAEPPAVKREPWEIYRVPEENHSDVNHSLVWLIEQLPQEHAVRQYGKRLLALRGRVSVRWKQEVQLALDVASVEDHLELADAWPRMKDVRPQRSKTGFRHPGGSGEGVVAFSPDGRHFATIGGRSTNDLRVWQTKDWTQAAPAIPLGGSIERLVFSPDGKYLYVAGGGGGLQIHARYDWKAGKLDRAYKGHKSGLADLALSADGKTMATSNYYEDVIHVWDTATGKIRKSFKTPHLAHEFALSADGKTLLRKIALRKLDEDDPKTLWTAEALEPGALEVPKSLLGAGVSFAAFSLDGHYFLTIGADNSEGGASLERNLRLFDLKDKFREVASSKMEMLPPSGVTFYPEAGVALLEGHWTGKDVHAVSLPALKPLKGFEKALQLRGTKKSACLSPDGKLLAVGILFRPTPYLFRTDTFEELLPFEGHGEEIVDVSFPSGGKIVRTLGRDNTVCTWDANTMKMLRRQHLPAGWNHESSREPDGRYLIGTGLDDKEANLAVFDVESNKTVASVQIASEMFASLRVYWSNDKEVFAVSAGELCHFDVTTGKVLARRKIEAQIVRGDGLTENGKELFLIDSVPKYPGVSIHRVSVESGKARETGTFMLRQFTGNSVGMVPGGKYFYLGNPGVYLFDRKTLKEVMSRAFRGTDVLGLHFTCDGSRFAAVTSGAICVDRSLRKWDPQTQSVVRIHDTPTGRTLAAFPASTRWVSVKFSPDGKKLAVINDDGTFELWDLSVLNRF